MTPSEFIHFFMLFVPGFIAGLWKLTTWIFVTGVLLPVLVVSDMNESPVIWCFFSTTQGLIALRAFQLHQRRQGIKMSPTLEDIA